jgi:hypothetical protein
MTSRREANEPFMRLRQRVEEILGNHGLEVRQLLFSADDQNEVHIRTRVTEGPPEDDKFEEVIASAHAAEVEQRAEEVRKALEDDMAEWFDG